MPNLVQLIKKAAIEAVNDSKPVKAVFGTVTSVNPLKINIEQRLTLDSDHLALTSIAANLSINERVVLLQVQGGQNYIILDKLVSV